ncbi:MAG TPA: class I SAM-dependent rRNA methyltransferase [Verrucomicrobiae bacterium]
MNQATFRPRPRRPASGPRFLDKEQPAGSDTWLQPWVQLKFFSYHPTIYPAMIRSVSPQAKSGDIVNIYDKEGQIFGRGLYNPNARVPLRVFYHGAEEAGDEYLAELLNRAIDLRLNILRLPEQTDAFRVIHSDGDTLSGLIVDKYGDVLSVEVHSHGVYSRLPGFLEILHSRLGTKRQVVHVDERIARMEGIKPKRAAEAPPRAVRIRENGVKFEVDFEEGHKTGFFCDQRENRLRLSRLVKDCRVLDLCCYTGGFAIAAAANEKAKEVTGVDLDEKAIAQAKRNANLNQVRVNWVHCDAFSYARQMQGNKEQWDVIILDPPKFVVSREEFRDGQRKYEDLNQLGISLLRPGGLLVTCSCSGLVSAADFEEFTIRAAHRQARRLQFLDRTEAGPDHPVMSNCPESRYLKVLWARVF